MLWPWWFDSTAWPIPAKAGGTRARSISRAHTRRPFLERFVVRTGDRVELLAAREVEWLEGAGDFVRLHCNGRRHVVRTTLTRLELSLDPAVFIRIRRSATVNLTRLREVHRRAAGNRDIVLSDGTRLVLSRRYRARFEASCPCAVRGS